jgi:hypothetical protein
VRRAVLLLLLAGLLAPATAAQACDTRQVETLETVLPEAPGAVSAGRSHVLTLRVTRAGQPAGDVNVFAVLRGARFDAHRSGVTAPDGRATLRLEVPPGARGAVELDVEAYRPLVHLPCAAVEEYDRSATPWGRVT